MSRVRTFLDNISPEELLDRLDLAVTGANLGIWDWDLRDDSVNFDRRWCAMLGLDHEAISPSLDTWSSLVHPDDIEQCFVDIKAHIAGETEFYENVHRMRHADGRWIYILDRGRISGRDADGSPVRMTGTHFDVTMTEEAKHVLQSQHDQMVHLVVAMPTAVAMVDTELRYLAASSRWYEAFGLEEAEVLGRRVNDVFPEISEAWQALQQRALAGEALSADEDRWERADGRVEWLRWALHPWRDAHGAVGGLILMSEDVTARVERRISAETAARLESMAVIAGGTAHELNTPLHVIGLETALARDELAAPDCDLAVVTECLEAVEEATTRAGKIVAAMGVLAGRDVTEREACAADALVENAAKLMRGTFRTRRIDLEVDVTGCASVEVRPDEIGQVLVNLLTNAADAVDGLPKTERWVRLEVAACADRVTIACVDGGPGVPAKLVERIKEPFFTTKAVGRGTGLGLALCHTLAKRNEAELRYDASAPNTRFILDLPRGRNSNKAAA